MTRLALVLVAAIVLLAPATALADTVWTLKDGTLKGTSDDPSVAGEYRLWVSGDRVFVSEPKDPQGNNVPIEAGCTATKFNGSGLSTEFSCPKAPIKSIIVEAGPGEDSVTYEIKDIPLTLAGATGADKATASDAADDLSGEQGNDALSAGAGDDFLNGDEGNDTLDGGAGNDKLSGATGTDSFLAGAGDDTVLAADGLAETVDCGEGNDTVTADAQDTLTACENVTRQNITAAEEATGDDTTRPKLAVGGSSSQRFSKAVRFVATCSEKGLVQAAGFVDAGGINLAIKSVTRKVTVGGGGVVVKLPFDKRTRRNISRDLRRKRKPRVRVTISCVDAAGNTSRAAKFWISLRRR